MIGMRRAGATLSIVFAATACATLAGAQPAAPAAGDRDTREANFRAYDALLRSDIRSQKVALITEIMQFTAAEDAKFWPVYREYETELAAINDGRIALIKDYVDGYYTLTDATADRLAQRALDLEGRRHALKVKYFERMKTVLPAKTVARFFQVEGQILLLMDLQVAAALPVASP